MRLTQGYRTASIQSQAAPRSCNSSAFELRFNSLMPRLPDKLSLDDTLGELHSGTMPDSDAPWMPQRIFSVTNALTFVTTFL